MAHCPNLPQYAVQMSGFSTLSKFSPMSKFSALVKFNTLSQFRTLSKFSTMLKFNIFSIHVQTARSRNKKKRLYTWHGENLEQGPIYLTVYCNSSTQSEFGTMQLVPLFLLLLLSSSIPFSFNLYVYCRGIRTEMLFVSTGWDQPTGFWRQLESWSVRRDHHRLQPHPHSGPLSHQGPGHCQGQGCQGRESTQFFEYKFRCCGKLYISNLEV